MLQIWADGRGLYTTRSASSAFYFNSLMMFVVYYDRPHNLKDACS